ncbi:hypothetical protein M422DRAFT_264551 [Sphaerobolus stellatus SS14]|uniref:DUF5648 domain-containing protein n=1 Tax=Sphaerobolus stellatus (strain SS14) TaxID=990650 RepID=A0A0C9UW28_SPHS4|nr:hypothetical protein M422DRAFT_264551 [Sphaerobolus stellatus SS14]
MKNILFALIVAFAMGHISAWSMDAEILSAERRAADTCGDPSVATTYYGALSQENAVHRLNTMAAFVAAQELGDQFQIDRPNFIAWTSPGQPSTTPLWRLINPTTMNTVYLTSTNGTTPTLSGFSNPTIISYVYPTQICGSVPLYAAAGPSDHWYTTNLIEHDELLGFSGWTDDGIAAYAWSSHCPNIYRSSESDVTESI